MNRLRLLVFIGLLASVSIALPATRNKGYHPVSPKKHYVPSTPKAGVRHKSPDMKSTPYRKH